MFLPMSMVDPTAHDFRAKGTSWDVIFVTSEIMALPAVGMLIMCTNAVHASALVSGVTYGDCGVALRIDSGASKCFMSGISMFTSWDPGAVNMTLNTAVSITITSRAVDTVNFKDFDSNWDQRTFFTGYRVQCYAPAAQPCGCGAADTIRRRPLGNTGLQTLCVDESYGPLLCVRMQSLGICMECFTVV